MNRLGTVILLLAALSASGTAQPRKFLGVWEARFKGDVFLTLKLQEGEPIAGTINGGNVQVNQDGDLIEASAGTDEFPISKPAIDGEKLAFEAKDNDGETMQFEMRLTGDGEAQFQFVNLPKGLKMKPFTLKRK